MQIIDITNNKLRTPLLLSLSHYVSSVDSFCSGHHTVSLLLETSPTVGYHDFMYSYDYPHPAVTVDVAVFSATNNGYRLLLIKRADPPDKGKWALPGGFVDIDEDLETAALRELQEETGISDIEIEQLHTFGKPDRDPRERVITVVYTAVVDEDLPAHAASDAEQAEWFDVNALPELAFDHNEIINLAYHKIGAKLKE